MLYLVVGIWEQENIVITQLQLMGAVGHLEIIQVQQLMELQHGKPQEHLEIMLQLLFHHQMMLVEEIGTQDQL